MPENIKTLRRRIKSVSSTRKITRTMEMISTAKLRRVQNAMMAARPYAVKIEDLIMHLARSEAAASQPLFARREDGRGLTVLVIASDRGLCGGYNSSVLRLAENYIAENGGRARVDVFTVGKRARDFLGKRDYHVVGSEI
ncbi:MAG: F0F1 ATP synthase subunit gamma, partial [Candidatus Sumerlaeota bacterium]|nr:F0F1 ATP synthase subunit gamma [Candidatus Sumerlaeota bacterium]